MCIDSKRIVNRSNHYDFTQPLFLTVPCNKCDDCLRKGQSEWFVRCYYEWIHNSGYTYFYTLTYNEDNLPYLNGIPCFEKKHIQNFIKRMRFHLGNEIKLKYMVTSEYGEKRQRPHYHALFFLSSCYNHYQFYKLVQRCWHYGFVKYGNDVGRVTSSAGIQYVTKYVTKDFAYTDKYDEKYLRSVYKRYTTFLNNLSLRYPYYRRYSLHLSIPDRQIKVGVLDGKLDKDDEFAHSLYYKCRHLFQLHRPFHLQSSKLGTSIMSLSPNVLFHEIVPVMQHGTCITYPLPRYIKRKLWYDCIENEIDGKHNKFVLNECGKFHYLSSFEDKVKNGKERYNNILSNLNKLDFQDLTVVNSFLDTVGFESVLDLRFWFDNFDLDLDVLSIYDNVFRDRVMTHNIQRDFTPEYVKEHYMDFVMECLEHCSTWDFGKAYELCKEQFNILERSLFNNHPYFQIYEHASSIFAAVRTSWRSKELKAKTEKEKLASAFRQLFN